MSFGILNLLAGRQKKEEGRRGEWKIKEKKSVDTQTWSCHGSGI